MSSSFKLLAIAVLLLGPLDTLAGGVYRRNDPQESLSEFDESQHLPVLVLISSLH
jgi:hypothetical protein